MDAPRNLKGRIGEAFVETILREAGYTVCRGGRESQMPRLFRIQEGEFLPDFFAWKPAGTLVNGAPVHRLLCVEVKFRSRPKDLLRPSELDPLLQAAAYWPELYLVLVTDDPEPGRSCFQLLDLKECERNPDSPLATADLHKSDSLGIDKSITDRYEGLVRRVFSPFREEDEPRKPLAKLPMVRKVPAEGRSTGGIRA